MHRGNRFLIGVVMGGRSGGSRDATMRSLLADNLDKAASKRTVAAITERNGSDANTDVADADADQRPQPSVQTASAAPQPPTAAARAPRFAALAQATAAVPPPPAKVEPAPLTNGVLQTQAMAVIPGSSEPMKPVKVKTVQVKMTQIKLASAGPSQPVTPITSAVPAAHPDVPETSNAVMAKAEVEPRTYMPPQPPGHGTGNGILGVLPASSVSSSPSQTMANAAPAPQSQSAAQDAAVNPVAVHTGWIVQVGALESEDEAQQRIEAARSQAHGLLAKADPFTETVIAKGDRKLIRARFAGLDRDQAEAVCRALKHSDISCMTVHN
jgi:D-alanyl-D-alanine carboxypeptidase